MIRMKMAPGLWMPRSFAIAATMSIAPVFGGPSLETSPIRPGVESYVPPPFSAIIVDKTAVHCGPRQYDLASAIPMPSVGQRALLERATLRIDGKDLTPSPPEWQRSTPPVATARRQWVEGQLRLELTQTVEYDGFITSDLVLTPLAAPVTVGQLQVELVFRPDVSVLYHIPAFSTTPAGLWPARSEIKVMAPGIWGGDDSAGLACYVATFRDWHSAGAPIVIDKTESGAGRVTLNIIGEQTSIERPVTYRLGFIATPVRPPEKKHWQIYSLPPGPDALQAFVTRNLHWGALSDRYATFRTNDPQKDPAKVALVQQIQKNGKAALAYTTYAHVEEGAAETPKDWLLVTAKGKAVSSSIGGAMAHLNRIFCCPGSSGWIDWKMADLEAALERYGVDGFYVDTSYIITACANEVHGHGWRDAQGQLQTDFPVWSMREIWRRSYELICQKKGRAEIYAHHKGGCPPALAAFTSAFCDGEQYTSQSIKNLTLDAFRAQISGRNVGPLALFLCEFYRSESLQTRARKEHHNPTESVMLPLLHDVLPTGYPGNHPVRELLALREDLKLADARWVPYHATNNPWKAEGKTNLPISSYVNAAGDTLFVVGNPTYADEAFTLTGPSAATEGRTFVSIDVLSRVGRHSPSTPGYRWEKADPRRLSVGARSLAIAAWITRPESITAFARQEGFSTSAANHVRRTPVPPECTLLDDFEDPDWTFASDEGTFGTADREPVDTRRALRVQASPMHHAAAIMRTFDRPQDWSSCEALSFWVRPEKDLPVRALDPRLRDDHKYGPALKLVSQKPSESLPAGQWTHVRYEFREAPRDSVHILRIYLNRGGLYSGPFDIDEMMLVGGKPADATPKAAPKGPNRKPVTPVDRPGAPPE